MKQVQILVSVLLLLFGSLQNAWTQQENTVQVAGTVTDENSEPMIGVTVSVKNEPASSAVSDMDGKYLLKAKKDATLVFSAIGYNKREVAVNGRTLIDVRMTPSRTAKAADDAGQQKKVTVSGTVIDENGEPMIGITVYVKNEPGLGVSGDIEGKYSISVRRNATLVFAYLGYDKQEIDVDGRSTIDVQMVPSESSVLDEVVVTATGAQKKASVSGAITTVDIKTLKMPTANITNALAGNVAGVIAMQLSGEPGSNKSEFWIRGISTFGAGSSALVLVDGFERPFNEINIEDIESFSILKDASATAIYGSRGANGVVIITTKRGVDGKINISGKVEYGYNTRTRTPEFVDGVTYATLLNEARSTRNLEPLYTDLELQTIAYNLDPDLYPNVDWKDILLKDGANTYRASINMSGGGSTARYFVSGSYTNEGGMYKTDDVLNKYNTNSDMERYNYRMNTDIVITSSSLLRVGVSGFLEKQNRAGLPQSFETFYSRDGETYAILRSLYEDSKNGIDIWKSIIGYSPIATPLQYSNGLTPAYGTGELTNPWVIATGTGYNEAWRSKVETNLTFEQNFNFITPGLRFTGRFAFDSDNKNNVRHILWPEQHNTQRRRDANGELVFYRVSTAQPMYQESDSWGERIYNLEGELSYNRAFNREHNVGLFLKYAQREQAETSDVGNNVSRGIPRRDQSLSGRISYDFRSRYFVEFNGGYTGSEVFKTGHQFGFFPAVSGAWNVSEEPLVQDLTSIFDMLKFRYSYGKVGNNKIKKDNEEIRFPYVATLSSTSGYDYGDYYSPNYNDISSEGSLGMYSGWHEGTIAADYLTWEVATKHNLGVDFSLWNSLFSGAFDVFKETRSDIYMPRKYLAMTNGIISEPWANIGVMENRGFDGQANYSRKFGQVDVTMRGNVTYTRNKILVYDEEANALPYKMTQGYRYDQAKGLIALGLFEDYDDIRNSPKQSFGAYMPGDIKYKDINGDGIINDNDEVAIGATRIPNLIYGVGVSAIWNGFDINVHFQGAGKSSYFISGPAVYPFSEIHEGNTLPWGNILTDVVGNYWSESNPDPNARYPRLSYGGNKNNYRNSTYWLRNGAYLRFKTLEIGYTIPKRITSPWKINNIRIHLLGSNLFVWDYLKIWDPELASGKGMDYPISKTFSVGVSISL
jgi:TonB-linked SusC/RagA family outer membrane protein